ncbi:MAG: DUF3168 domain-containing protein [Rhodobacteraceae bacterium]|nr:DUF3168 domain-containing protein [Paracoccaceae bacterium]
MTYALSAPLQAAVYQALLADAGVSGLVGADIYDALPTGSVPALYVLLGDEKVKDASDGSGQGAWHDFAISVVSEADGFANAKQVAGAVSDALVDAPLTLSTGRLVSLHFVKARASREPGGLRRINLTFRARLEAA